MGTGDWVGWRSFRAVGGVATTIAYWGGVLRGGVAKEEEEDEDVENFVFVVVIVVEFSLCDSWPS